MAFTRNGGRMGYGGGYYDRYLNTHSKIYPQKKVSLVALAFQEQIVPESSLPLDEHDVKLDKVITA